MDPLLVDAASQYLGCLPYIYSVNTFWTLPEFGSPFTHDFHRDVEDLEFLVFFIFWTNTSSNDGAFEYVKCSHAPSSDMIDRLRSSNPDDLSFNTETLEDISDEKLFDTFLRNTVPGYGKSKNYNNIFEKEDFVNKYGKKGSLFGVDNFGLHRGTPVQIPRLVTWIRFGVSDGRPGLDFGVRKTKLSENLMSIVKNSKYKNVLDLLLTKEDVVLLNG